jgi:hypothetical protein
LTFEVLDRSSVGGESVDERTYRSLLHASVTGHDRVLQVSFRFDEGADGREETSGGSSVTEVDLLGIFRGLSRLIGRDQWTKLRAKVTFCELTDNLPSFP